jgi:hypothetical protein
MRLAAVVLTAAWLAGCPGAAVMAGKRKDEKRSNVEGMIASLRERAR